MSARPGQVGLADALAVHFSPEPFQSVAQAALALNPLIPPGVCLNPGCSARFEMRRPWQLYCSGACRAAGDREFRSIGHRAAPALLAWQMGRYATKGSPLAELSRAGRNYYSALAASWLRDRSARAAAVSGREAG